jgi:VWFA-related protein
VAWAARREVRQESCYDGDCTSCLDIARTFPEGPALLALLAILLQTPAPQFKSGVDVVRFDVVVLDKARQPIGGLTAADFRITENSQPLRIAGFEVVTIPASPPTASTPAPSSFDPHVDTATNRRNEPGRLVVIVMDRTIGYEQSVVTARRIANAAIDELGPNDLAAVVFTSGISGNQPQGFTADRDRLRAAVRTILGIRRRLPVRLQSA